MQEEKENSQKYVFSSLKIIFKINKIQILMIFKREIILSDHPDRFVNENYEQDLFNQGNPEISNAKLGQLNRGSQGQGPDGTLNNKNSKLGQLNRPTIYQIDPKSLHFIDDANQNDTFMVDDIKDIYDPLAANQRITTQKKSFKHQPYGSSDKLIDSSNEKVNNYSSSQSDYDNRMRQELSGEDVYTLRFSTTLPIESYDSMSRKQPQHQSYLYNGTINRPAFEVISHADVRPATPIKFEEAKELKHFHTMTTERKRKSSMSPKKWNDDEIDCCHRRPHHTHHHSPNRQIHKQRRTRIPSFSDEIHYNERINVGPTTFESSSWIESKKTNTTERTSSCKRSKLKYARSHTSPIHLNYGCEKSVKNTGEPVQWQIAGELRTTDWDKLKSLDDTHHTQTYCYTSYDKAHAYERHHFNHHNQNMEPAAMPISSERYMLSKKFQPARGTLPPKFEDNVDIDEYEYAENYSDIKHSTLGVNNPFNNNGSGGLGGLVEGVTSVNDIATPPEFIERTTRKEDREILVGEDGEEEQSKRKKSFKKNSNLLDENENNNYTNNTSTSNKFSFNDLTKHNIDKYFSSRKKTNLNSNSSNMTLMNNKNTLNSDIDNNDLSSWRPQSTSNAAERRRNSSSNTKQQKRTSVSSSNNSKNRQTLLDPTMLFTKEIIRDPNTNEILSVKQIDNNYNDFELGDGGVGGFNGLNHGNVSIVDVAYNNISERRNSQQIDEHNLPSLLPPLEFQQAFHQNEDKTRTETLINNGEKSDKAVLRRDNLRTNSRHSTHSTKKHESEDFLATNEINLNFDDIYESTGGLRKSESVVSQEMQPQTSPRTPGTFKNVIDEIKSFDSGRLKNTGTKNVMNVYEKNLNLLDNNRRQSISKNPPPPPSHPPPPLSHNPSNVSNSKAADSIASLQNRRFSKTGSNASETNSAHLY